MTFNEETRELTSSTGCLRSKDGGLYSDHPIYLGKYDSPENYEEITKKAYKAWEKETGADLHERED